MRAPPTRIVATGLLCGTTAHVPRREAPKLRPHSDVQTAPPVTSGKTWIPAIVDVKQAGPNQFIYGTDVGTWTGTFVDESTEDFVVVCHAQTGFSFSKGTIEFTGNVDGPYGTLTLQPNGIQESDTCDPSPAPWSGRWVIIGGTGELAGLHGNGTFTGPSRDLDYAGQIHFD